MTRVEIIARAQRVERDLVAFQRSRDCIKDRMQELQEDDPEYYTEYMDWAAVQALMNVFVLSITRCEGLLEDYQKLLNQCDVIQLVPRDQP